MKPSASKSAKGSSRAAEHPVPPLHTRGPGPDRGATGHACARALVLALLAASSLSLASCDTSSNYSHLYQTAPRAPSYTDQEVQNLDHMGPTVVDHGVNFSVYSEHATRMELMLFDDPDSDRYSQRFPMHRFGNVWNVYVEGVGYGQHYGYAAWGPNWTYDPAWYPGSIKGFVADVDADGNRFDPNKLLTDPYAKALHRDHDWSEGSAASGPSRTESDYKAASKSVIVQSHYQWSPNEATWRQNRQSDHFDGHDWNDLIIYEVHPKGFTKNPASGVDHPGTFRGVGEMASYLEDLGVTAVELMPTMSKGIDGGYWGYWTINFFAPEITYSTTMDPLRVEDELKWMVDQLHQHGIEVLLDVVYNHTGEGGLWQSRRYIDDFSLDPSLDTQSVMFEPKEIAALYSFRGLDNQAYYALSTDNQTYWDNTGVGNETRPNHTPFRHLILDSLRYFVQEMHVDGFRFDLAAILGEKDMDYNHWDMAANTVLQDIIDDPVLSQYNTRIIAEPWSAGGSYGSLVGAYPASSTRPGVGWYEWNPIFRHWWRSFVNIDAWNLNTREGDGDGGSVMTGSHDTYAWNGRRPYHSINYITIHDGFTMYDLMCFNAKQNGCGPLNPVCCSRPRLDLVRDPRRQRQHRSRDWGADNEAMKRQLMRNLFVAMMFSHGTPMLLGGDEWMRTQLGNNNAYSTGADKSATGSSGVLAGDDERNRMHDFVRKAIRFRKDHRYAFAPTDWDSGAPFAWKEADNTNKSDWSNRHLMIHYYDSSAGPELLHPDQHGPGLDHLHAALGRDLAAPHRHPELLRGHGHGPEEQRQHHPRCAPDPDRPDLPRRRLEHRGATRSALRRGPTSAAAPRCSRGMFADHASRFGLPLCPDRLLAVHRDALLGRVRRLFDDRFGWRRDGCRGRRRLHLHPHQRGPRHPDRLRGERMLPRHGRATKGELHRLGPGRPGGVRSGRWRRRRAWVQRRRDALPRRHARVVRYDRRLAARDPLPGEPALRLRGLQGRDAVVLHGELGRWGLRPPLLCHERLSVHGRKLPGRRGVLRGLQRHLRLPVYLRRLQPGHLL